MNEYANILSVTVLNEEEGTFSVLTDWTDESGADWPSDAAVQTVLEGVLGFSVAGVDFTDSGDDLNEGIYTWHAA